MIERRTHGLVPVKHHTILRDAQGRLCHEECMTRDGFEGPYTLLYHQHRPHTAKVTPPAFQPQRPQPAPAGPLARHHYPAANKAAASGPPLVARTPMLFNADIVLSITRPTASDTVYFSNGDADELHYIQQGAGSLVCPLGRLEFVAGDYVYIPKGMAHRFDLPPSDRQHWLSLEASGGFHIPTQWRTPSGQLRMDAPYCHRDFRHVTFTGPIDEGIRHTVVKRQNDFHGFESPHNPMDVVGWDGAVYPLAFPISNFQARVGQVHLPPTWHGTFAARGALVCSFVPRPVDFHPDAIPCPYPHSSVDCDEVLFYCDGNFTSRKGVGPGSLSFHPAGVAHGPHPGAYEASIGSVNTNETAVMLDTVRPLTPTKAARDCEDLAYHDSFA